MIRQGTDILKEHSKGKLSFRADLQQINFLDTRVYKRKEGLYYPSVTTVLQYMPKGKFFEDWLKDVGHSAEIIVAKASREGTQVHEAAEKLVLGEEVEWLDDYGNAKYSQRVWEMIMRFYDFWTTCKPELIQTEGLVYSDKYQFAGTADLVVKLNGKIWLIDIKTSNAVQRAYSLQLAAYKQAIEEQTKIKIEKAGILWLKAYTRKPSKRKGIYQGRNWQLKEVSNLDKNFKLFMYLYEFYKLDHPKVEPIYTGYPTALKIK